MNDPIFQNFLRDQHARALALAAASDILQVWTDGSEFPQRYVARFHCRSVVISPGSEPRPAESDFEFGLRLPDDYLREPEPQQVVMVFRPWVIYHPNVSGPFICLGRLAGGTPLTDILFQIYEIISFQKWSAHDGLNEEACEWARGHQDQFPLDRRPLKRKEIKA
jgi:hypothetical protein